MRSWIFLLALALTALPTAANAWWQKEWSYRKQLQVDLSPSGVNVSGPVGRTPVLIRLHSGNFQFADAQDKGQDLRFIATDDKTPLAYHIETFDPLLGVATIWVDVPNLNGGEKATVWLYYGNKTAPATLNTPGTFDPDYVLVYHYDDAAAAPSKDKTNYGNSARNAPGGITDASIIGHGAKFTTTPLQIGASPSTAITAGGALTFSTWVKEAAPSANAVLYARHDGAKSFIIGLQQGVPYMTISGGTGAARLAASQNLAPGQWSHLAVVADGKSVSLYVNGRPVGTGAATLPALNGDTLIGGDAGAPFAGELDETRLSKVARNGNMILADANGQGPNAKLVTFGNDEKQGGHSNTFAIILKSVDATAFVVIGILGVMGVITGWVIYSRTTYYNTLDKANKMFVDKYRKLGGDLESIAIEVNKSPASKRSFERSNIYRIYNAGAEEIRRREDSGEDASMHPEAIEVMRALMDAVHVRENQRLTAGMVMLTIAIAGGPFIGLLGTVIGVMVTFAEIAAAGDVNVNAIAPGISAALLATVAGLAVAIPALFAYNYLQIRSKNIVANMHVFVDEFLARTGEIYRHHAHHPTLKAAE